MLIDEPAKAAMVPFHFRPVQNSYYDLLVKEYGSQWWFEDVDELILKARKEGFTSFWLSIFAAILLMYPEPRRFMEVSYKIEGTLQHFRRMRGFLLSPIIKDPQKWDEKLFKKVFSTHNEGSEMVLKSTGGSFYAGTAAVKTGERGGTTQGVLLSEAASYPDTTAMTASEIIESARQLVAVDSGLKVIETTAKGFTHLYRRWIQAKNKLISARPRFFGWKEMYTKEQFAKIAAGFSDKDMIKQEYPETAEEAFLVSGRPAFNQTKLQRMVTLLKPPLYQGYLLDNKKNIEFIDEKEGELKVWRSYEEGHSYAIVADPAGGLPLNAEIKPKESDYRAWSVGAVFDRSTAEVVAELRLRCDPGEFGRKLCVLGEFYNWSLLIPESNNHGAATIEAIRTDRYPHLIRTTDIWGSETADQYGFPTNNKTKPLILAALRNAIENQYWRENSEVAIDEMIGAQLDAQGSLISDGFLDCVITRAIGLYCLKFLSLDDTYREKHKRPDIDNDQNDVAVSSTVPKRRRMFRKHRQVA